MAYSTEKLTKLGALKALAERIARGYATKGELGAVARKVSDLEEAGGEPNVITQVRVNGTVQTVTGKAVDIAVPTAVSGLENDSGFQTGAQVEARVNAKLSSVYRPGGNCTFAGLPALEEENLGLVVNVTERFTTTADFVEGAGSEHPAGTNVAVVQAGEAYKYDALAGFVDLTGYARAEQVSEALGGKVSREEGKGLSSNDYSDEEKEKLGSIEFATDEEVSEMLAEVFGVAG